MLLFGTKKEETAQKALSKALLNLCMKTSIAFYAQVLLRLPISFTNKTATAYASKTRIYLNEQYFLFLVPKEREILLVHELLHIVLQHHERKQTRNALLWNVACDYAVDILLVDYFGSITGTCIGCKTPSGVTVANSVEKCAVKLKAEKK